MTASAVGYPQVHGQACAREDACHGASTPQLGRPLCLHSWLSGPPPAALARAHRHGRPSRAGRATDSGAALVDGSTVGPRGRESPAHPRCPDAAAVWPGRGGGARHDPLGAWEVWLAGIVVAGRTMPIGWAVIPYPWPKGRFRTHNRSARPAVAGRLPTPRCRGLWWRTVAFRVLSSLPYSVKGVPGSAMRLRLSDWVMVARVYTTVAEHLVAGRLVDGRRTAATMGRGRPDQPLVPGWVVVSTAVVAPPNTKQNPGTAREQAQRAKAMPNTARTSRAQDEATECHGAALCPDLGALHYGTATVGQAVAEYAQRMPIEETFRDWHSGWGVRAAVVDLPTEAMVDRLIGVVCCDL